jgi:hypothetical protein
MDAGADAVVIFEPETTAAPTPDNSSYSRRSCRSVPRYSPRRLVVGIQRRFEGGWDPSVGSGRQQTVFVELWVNCCASCLLACSPQAEAARLGR